MVKVDLVKLEESVKKKLSPKRFNHSKRVMETALVLAEKHEVDLEKIKIAALLHDYAKDLKAIEMVRLIERSGGSVSSLELAEAEILHGPVAAIIAREEFLIEDKDILESIKYHTTGNVGLSKLAKIIYLADAIEPSRQYPGLKKIRETVEEDLDMALLLSLDSTLEYLIQKGRLIHPLSIETRNDLIMKNKRSEVIE